MSRLLPTCCCVAFSCSLLGLTSGLAFAQVSEDEDRSSESPATRSDAEPEDELEGESAPAADEQGGEASSSESRSSESHAPRVVWEPEARPLVFAPGGAEVLLEIVLGGDGQIEDVNVREASPVEERARLEEAALTFVGRVRFEPAAIEGQAVRVRFQYRVVFPPAAPPQPERPTGPEGDEEVAGVGREALTPLRATSDGAVDGGTVDEGPPATSRSLPEEDDDDELGDAGFGATAEVESPVGETERSAISEMEIDVGELGRVPRDNAQNLLSLAPGLLLTQLQNEGHAAAMFLRGFDAEEGEDLEVLLEGIPLNEPSNAHGHGYADTLVVLPQLVEEVRVVQGAFDPAQGDFATAGSAEYRLGLRERGIHGQLGYGSYGQRRVALWWGPEGHERGTVAGFSYNGGDGWGANRAFTNVAVMGQYEGLARERRLRYRILLFGAAGNWDQPGLLRADDFETRSLPCAPGSFGQFYCTYDPRQSGSSTRLGGSVGLTWTQGPTRIQTMAFAMGRRLRIQENFTGFSGDPRTDGGAQRGDLTDQRYGATTLGLRASYRRRFRVLERPQQLELGLYARQDFADTALDRVRSPTVGPAVPYATDFDRALSISNIAGYLRADLEFTDWLALMIGVRVDAFGFQSVDRNFASEDIYGERLTRDAADAFGVIVEPRGALRVALGDSVDWITSLGRGARSSDAAALSEGELAPFAEVLSAETGLALTLGDEEQVQQGEGYFLRAGLSAFFTRVSQDLVFDAANGRNTVIGPSHRSGMTASTRLQVGRWLDTQLAITHTRAHLPPTDASTFDLFAGPRLPYIPSWLVRLDSALRHAFRVGDETIDTSLAFGALYLAPRPLPFEQFSASWFVLDAAVSARWRYVELGVSAQNLLNQRYRNAEFSYVSNFGDPEAPPSMMASRHFAAAPPLRLFFTLTVHLQFDEPADAEPEDTESEHDDAAYEHAAQEDSMDEGRANEPSAQESRAYEVSEEST